MRYPIMATFVASVALYTSPALAQTSQSATASKSATPSKNARPSKSARPSKGASPSKGVKPSKRPGPDAAARTRVKSYNFLADEIDGDRILPDNTTIFGRDVVVHDSLLRLRTEFISEIIKSAE